MQQIIKNISIGAASSISKTRGAFVTVAGNENASTGGLVLATGDASGSNFISRLGHASSSFFWQNASDANLWKLDGSNGALTQDATNGGNIVLSKAASEITLSGAGSTIAIQEGTAGQLALVLLLLTQLLQ